MCESHVETRIVDRQDQRGSLLPERCLHAPHEAGEIRQVAKHFSEAHHRQILHMRQQPHALRGHPVTTQPVELHVRPAGDQRLRNRGTMQVAGRLACADQNFPHAAVQKR
jgi:hypothetical protein